MEQGTSGSGGEGPPDSGGEGPATGTAGTATAAGTTAA